MSDPKYKLALAAAHQAVGVLAGYACAAMRIDGPEAIAFIVIPFVLGRAFETFVEPEKIGGAKGWLGYGFIGFLTAWITSWVYFINFGV